MTRVRLTALALALLALAPACARDGQADPASATAGTTLSRIIASTQPRRPENSCTMAGDVEPKYPPTIAVTTLTLKRA